MKWASLHHHSTFSYQDGYGTVQQHVDRAAELGMGSMALTEHGNISSHVQLEKAAVEAGIKPIFGCELYTAAEKTASKWHLTVLAENEIGYQNLNKLVTAGWQNFYFEPTVSGEMLAEHSEGLIVLSGCSGSKMACDLLGGKGVEPHEADTRAARRTAQRFKDLLGDRFYLEVQTFPELERAQHINQAWESLGSSLGIPLVATGDIHYPRPEDSDMQVILHAAGRGNKSFEQQQQSWGYDIKLTSPLTDQEVLRRTQATGISAKGARSAVRTAGDIAARCSVVLPKADRLRFPLPDGMPDSKTMIWKKLQEGWRYRAPLNPLMRKHRKQYLERLKYEMEVIEEKDFIDYFLSISDVVSWAKDSGIPVGPARGSAAASFTCYLLRITEIDPLQYPTMFFERFVDRNRTDIPDIDLDFDDDRRSELLGYLKQRYGDDRVGTIGTFTRYKSKNSLEDVARVYRIPGFEVEKVKSVVVERSGGDARADATLADTVEMFPQAKEVFEKYPQLMQATRLEGNLRGMSVHPAGHVVANTPITDICATYQRVSGGRTLEVLSVDKYDAEYLNLMKADFLGLKTMGMIRLALEFAGLTLDDLYAIKMDEPATMQAFRENDVVGVFQFEGRATRIVNRSVVPENFMELADINALSRPGPLFSGTTTSYVETKHGRMEPEKFHPAVDRITDFTKGQIIYQEQILQIVREVGDFPWTHAQQIRKIISQKHGAAAFNESFGVFKDGARRLHGIDEELAYRIWNKLATAGVYAFCTTGDTVVKTGGKGSHGGNEYTLKALWEAYNSKTSIGGKLRNGQRGKRICLQAMDDDGKIRPSQFRSIERSAVKMPVYRITLANGNTFKGTIMHRVMTDKGYREVGDLTVGDVVICAGERGPGKEASKGTQQFHAHGGSMNGPGNPAWVDGRTGLLRTAQAEVAERSGNRCEHCDRANDERSHTLEFAHILMLNDLAGDYAKYHSAANLIHLCNSCHKKFDYGKGERVKRWSRGLLTVGSAITFIKPLKTLEYVYMIEMNDDAHNYVGNGIIHHNNVAHSVSYSMLAFWCMWLKVHYPMAFYPAQLQKTKEANMPRVLKDALKHGVEVRPPSPNKSALQWTPVKGRRAVRAGLEQIPGVGTKMGQVIIGDREANGWFKDWSELMRVKGVGPKKLEVIRSFTDVDDPFELTKAKRLLDPVREAIRTKELPIALPKFKSDDLLEVKNGTYVHWIGLVKLVDYKDVIENYRARYGGTVEEVTAKTKNPELATFASLFCYDEGDEDVYLRVNRYVYPKFKADLDGIKVGYDVVYASGKVSNDFGVSIQVKELRIIDPEV